MPVYGQTLPPIGFVQFCRGHAAECSQGSGRAAREHLTEARWDELVKVNDYVNAKVEPVTDQELYQVPELWTYPDNKGDCEDYVLLKRRYLVNLGWSPESLLITVVRDRNGDGHAVLTVATHLGEFVLDNQNTDILPWQSTRYQFQKRQSQTHPSVWVSLRPDNNEPKVRGTLTGVLEVSE
jgi:predicted transglutaminase-like cysteine proteinase